MERSTKYGPERNGKGGYLSYDFLLNIIVLILNTTNTQKTVSVATIRRGLYALVLQSYRK